MPKLTINDALTTYGKQIRKYTMRMSEVRYEKESLAKIMEEEPEKAVILKEDYDRLELSYQALSKKHKEYCDYTAMVTELQASLQNIQAAKNEADAYAKESEEMSKCMQVAIRYGKGDRVPAKDLKKLMEKFPELYTMAEQMRMMSKKTKKKHKSLWEDEDEKPEDQQDIGETEAPDGAPEIVEADAVASDAGGPNAE